MGLVAAIALPLAALEAYSLHAEYKSEVRHAEMNALYLAEGTAASVKQYLDDARSVATSLASWMGAGGFDRACGALSVSNRVITQFRDLIVVDLSGRVRCTTAADPGASERDYSGSSWFRRTLQTGRPELGALTADPGGWSATMGFPLRDESGQMIGAVGASMDPPRFQALLTSMELPEDGVVTVFDNLQTVVARSSEPTRWVGRRIAGAQVAEIDISPGRKLTRTSGLDGLDRTWGSVTLEDTGWQVSAGLSRASINAPLRVAALRKAAGSMTLLVLVVALALSLYRRIDSALQGLVRRTSLDDGQEGVALPSDGPAEVLEVGRQFDKALQARSRAEAAERRAKVRYRSILENAIFGIYVSSVDGRFLEVNPALVEMLGYESREELEAVNLRDLYTHPMERQTLVDEHRGARLIDHVEVEWRKRDGTLIVVRLNGNTVYDAETGEPAFEVIVEDITEQRALEAQYRQTQRMEAIGRLAGGVAHDFNNLLTVMIGQTRLLMADLPADSYLRESANEVVEAGERASGLTRQLLAFSRKEVARPGLLDLNRVVGDLEKMLVRLIGEDVVLETSLGPELQAVHADSGQMEQVLMNLVVNARDAMPEGGRIRVETANVALDGEAAKSHHGLDPGEYVCLRVTDSGVGMSPEIRVQVFEPFFTTKPTGVGTGLGLSTVYGIVTQSGGGIAVRSEVGLGSTFEVLLPARAGRARAASTDAAGGVRTGQGQTVLVVEDEAPVRSVVTRILNRVGYRVLAAESGEDALALAREHPGPIDLTITDMVMPGMRGTELARRMADARPDSQILFISGYTDTEQLRLWTDEDPSVFLPKPFTPESLLDRVHERLRISVAQATSKLVG